MSRKRLTQLFPFLLPLRKWQRKKLFYLKMRMDGSKYANSKLEKQLPYVNQCEIGYELTEDIKIEERSANND